jgi:hypothetical protein
MLGTPPTAWPGDWANLAIPVTRHRAAPLPAEVEVEADDDDQPPAIPDVLARPDRLITATRNPYHVDPDRAGSHLGLI